MLAPWLAFRKHQQKPKRRPWSLMSVSPLKSRDHRSSSSSGSMLAGHQVGDGGFEIGLIDVGFRKCGPQVSEIVDDEIKGLIVTARHNRRYKARPLKNSKCNGYREKVKHETEASEPKSITADRPCNDIGRRLRHRSPCGVCLELVMWCSANIGARNMGGLL